MILWTYAFFVDNGNHKIERKEGHEDYARYVQFLLRSILTSNKQSDYVPQSDSTEVVSCVKESVKCSIAKPQTGELIEKVVNNCVKITERFMNKEIEAQSNVQRMNIEIKNGCLIHAFIEENGIYQYLIAKMDWTDFLERRNLLLSQGIEVDKKHLGKSCLFSLEFEGSGVEISKAQILLDNQASYFWNNFLELSPIYRDDYCTKTMVDTTVRLIDKSFKARYPQDRLLLKNTFIHYVRSKDFIDFDDIQKQIFEPYLASPTCGIDQMDKTSFIEKMKQLPETKRFSRQFNKVEKEINVNIVKSAYKLTSFANLEIHDAESNQKDVLDKIQSGSDANGLTYLKIYTDNDEAIKTFKPHA